MARSSLEPLDDPRLASLWSAVHNRLEKPRRQGERYAVHLKTLTEDERAAVDRLLGRRSRGETVRVDLQDLDVLLRERLGLNLVEAVTSLVGPVRDRPGERAVAVQAEEAMWAKLSAQPALSRHPGLEIWLLGLRDGRKWWRMDSPETTFMEALAVLDRLPQTAPRGRSSLAVQVLGDAHALDDQTPVGRLVLSALAHLDGTPMPLRAADRRRLWADQGVVSDETSSSVLTLGLRPVPVGPLTQAAGLWASARVPLILPLAAVQSETWRVPVDTAVWVCENPSVLAAAAGTGACVVCVEGRPSVAANLLLSSLAKGGARLYYHGDFGAGGISIANAIIGGIGAEPWRLGVADHASALERARAMGTPLRPLRAMVPEAVWDPDLATAVRASGVEVEEELVMDWLLADLLASSP